MKKYLIILFLIGSVCYGQTPIRTYRLSADTIKISNTATLPTHPTSGVKETWYRSNLWLTDSLNHYLALSTKHLNGISGILKAANDTIKVASPVVDYMPAYNLALATDYENAHLYSNGDLVRVVDSGITYIFIVKITHISGVIIPDPLDDMLAFGNNIHYELASSGSGNVEGSGTINRLSRWVDTDSLDSSIWRDNGTNLGIGIDPDVWHNKLIDIEDTTNMTTLYINNTKTITGVGTTVLGVDIISNSPKPISSALRGVASGGTAMNIGLDGEATGGTSTYGVYGNAVSESGGTAYGGWFSAYGDGTNYSLWAEGNAYFEGSGEVMDTFDVRVLKINHALFEPSTYIDTTRIAYKDKKNIFTRGQVIDVATLDYEYDKWWEDSVAYGIKQVANKNLYNNGYRYSYLGSFYNDTITGPKYYMGTGGFAKIDAGSYCLGAYSQTLTLEIDSTSNAVGIYNNIKSGYSVYSYGLQSLNTSTDTSKYFHGIFSDSRFKKADEAYGIKSYLSGGQSNVMYGLHLSFGNTGVQQNKNVYGIYISDASFGTTNSYSIYSAGGNAHFRDTVDAERYRADGKLLTVIRDTTVTLSAAEVMTLYSVGKTLVPTPGSGYAIEALTCSYKWTYVGDAYDSKSDVLYIGTTKNSLNTAQFGLGVFWAGTSTVQGKCQPYVTSTQAFEDNKALILSTSNNDAANGTSTLKAWITYRIITL